MIRFAHLLCASSLILVPGAGFAQQVVGAVGAANAAPTGRAPGQATRALRPGGDIFFKDRIATKRGGSAQLTFLDRSTLSVGENSDLVIDEFVYDPGASGTMRATLSKGVLRFVGGDISHGGGATVNTPAVTIGIRGGIATIGYVKDGADLDAIPGVPANFHGGAIVVNGYGQMTVRNRASEVVLSRPGFAVFVGSAGESIAAPVRLDPKATQALMKALASKGRQHGGASTKVAAAFAGAGIGHLVEVPVALPQLPPIDALDFTSVFSAGSALARNQAQSNQASQLHLQIMRAAVASIATTTASAMTTMTTSNTKSATPAATTARYDHASARHDHRQHARHNDRRHARHNDRRHARHDHRRHARHDHRRHARHDHRRHARHDHRRHARRDHRRHARHDHRRHARHDHRRHARHDHRRHARHDHRRHARHDHPRHARHDHPARPP